MVYKEKNGKTLNIMLLQDSHTGCVQPGGYLYLQLDYFYEKLFLI